MKDGPVVAPLVFTPVGHELEIEAFRRAMPFGLEFERVYTAAELGLTYPPTDFDITGDGTIHCYASRWRGHELVAVETTRRAPNGRVSRRGPDWFIDRLNFLPSIQFVAQHDESVYYYLSSIGGYHGEINVLRMRERKLVGSLCVGQDVEDLLVDARENLWLCRFDVGAGAALEAVDRRGATLFSFGDISADEGPLGVGLTRLPDGHVAALMDNWWLDDSSFAGTILKIDPETFRVEYHGVGRAGYVLRTPLDSWWSSSFAGIAPAPDGVFVSQSEFEWDGQRKTQKSVKNYLAWLSFKTGFEWRGRFRWNGTRPIEVTRIRSRNDSLYALDVKNRQILVFRIVAG